MGNDSIVLAGATGNLGSRIARGLLALKAGVRALVRRDASAEKYAALRQLGVEVLPVDFSDVSALARACEGAPCVVSALSGLHPVIVEAQSRLLDAAVQAGCARFIPSDFAIDFTKLPGGSNRNLDLRRRFRERVEQAPIAATSILNGAFTELLAGQAPFIVFPLKRVVYWESSEVKMDFTTMDDTAQFAARVALEILTPRFLRIAGDVVTAPELAAIASEVTGHEFKLLRAGPLNRLDTMIKVTRALTPERGAVYPAWQGMQYMRDMFSGLAKLEPLDNGRYPDMRWTSVKDVLTAYCAR